MVIDHANLLLKKNIKDILTPTALEQVLNWGVLEFNLEKHY